MGKDIIKQVEKYIIKTKTKITDDGEKLILNISFNPELIEFIKQGISTDKRIIEENFDFSGIFLNKRFKIKTAVFNHLNWSYAGLLFNKDLLTMGNVDIILNDISSVNQIISNLKKNLKDLVKFYYNLGEENIISFKVESL